MIMERSHVSVVQSSEEDAITAVLRAATAAFYGRDAEAWQAAWLHDAGTTRTLVASTKWCIR